MSDPEPAPNRYALLFLTNEWEWDRALAVSSLDDAKNLSREALEKVVREETPQLACVTVFEDGVRVGIWDWVENQPYWTRL